MTLRETAHVTNPLLIASLSAQLAIFTSGGLMVFYAAFAAAWTLLACGWAYALWRDR